MYNNDEVFIKSGSLIDATEEGILVIQFAKINEIDKQGDLYLPGSITSKDVVPMSGYNHSMGLPIGTGSMYEKGDVGIWSGQIDLDNENAANTYKHIRAMGKSQEYSWKFSAAKEDIVRPRNRRGRNFKKVYGYEVSPVLRGIGNSTHTIVAKSNMWYNNINIEQSEKAIEILKEVLKENGQTNSKI